MASTLTATFETRREAELVIERLVQEFAVDRKAITVGPEGYQNTVGTSLSGGDENAGDPGEEARDDAPLEGRIQVSVDLGDRTDGDAVRSAFSEFGGERVGKRQGLERSE